MAAFDVKHATLHRTSRRLWRHLLVCLVSIGGVGAPALAQNSLAQNSLAQQTLAQTTQPTALARLLDGAPPNSVEELKALQQQIQRMRPTISAATVAVLVGRANGSGIIVDKEGTVLTAAHVSGRPGRMARIVLADGTQVTGITRGLNEKLDAGLIQITDAGKWPYVPLGESAGVQEGQWCLATGHPGGYEQGRPPVLRMGRVLRAEDSAILTDCTLKGGDSGGPLFNLRGEVIGIHSRIGKNLSVNVHVPIDSYVAAWDRLKNGEAWGPLDPSQDQLADGGGSAERAWLGVVEDPDSEAAKVFAVSEGSPAEAAGIRVGDVILMIDEQLITNFPDLQDKIAGMPPGGEISVIVQRDSKSIVKQLRLGRRHR